ncbi:hypothetical protein FVE85_6952 [Porphyridium purpureum]|uniref:Uncharacterized protein n=1 Tax=Porphyridium purpureum TaxID=35688 RepID=A0A5J4Z9Q0_PORPP|nr:hypothetical protein FVE85_6952 [Porphyridium purpureum]|eukprot:POR2726..scf295_1
MKMFALGILVVAIAVLADHGEGQTIAGYTFESDVIDRAEIDLDMADISSLTDASEFVGAKTLYENGLNSVKADGSIRTIRGLSTSAGTKMTGQPTFDTYEAYWGSPNYGDNFVIQALDGTGMFAAASNIFRAECATKGAQYQIVWMYVIHELEDGRNDCLAGDINDNIGGVQAVDEGWAFYTGSLVGELGTEAGQLLWGLAEKRATNFDTITDGKATVNTRLLELWKKLQASSQSDCANMREDIDEVIRLLLIPLYQGALRYAYRADPASGFGGGSKEWGEGWAFVAALLPMAARESPDDVAYIRSNFDPESTNAPVGDGYEAVMDRLYSSAAKLGISAEELGTLGELNTGTPTPTPSDSPGTPTLTPTPVPSGSPGMPTPTPTPTPSDSPGTATPTPTPVPSGSPGTPTPTPTPSEPTPTPVCIDAEWIEARGLEKVHASDGVGELLCITGLEELPCGTRDHVLEVTVDAGAARMRSASSTLRTYEEVCAERECTTKVGRFNGVLHGDAHKLPIQDGHRVTTVSRRGTVWSGLENRIVVGAQKLESVYVNRAMTYLQRRNSAMHLSKDADA